MAQIAGYNENCTFYFAGTTFVTVRQNQLSESRKTHGYISHEQNTVQQIFLVSPRI
jgi:hypothetical protein